MRYGSVLLVGAFFAFMSLAGLERNGARTAVRAYALLVLLVVAGASVHSAWHNLGTDIPDRARLLRDCERNVKAYVATGDPSHLEPQRIPFPDPKWLARILAQPTLKEAPAGERQRDPPAVGPFEGEPGAGEGRRLRHAPRRPAGGRRCGGAAGGEGIAARVTGAAPPVLGAGAPG